MATIKLSKSQFACISNKNIIVFPFGDGACRVYKSNKPVVNDPDPSLPKGNEEGSEEVLASGYSPSGRHFVSCDDYKQLSVWRVSDADGDADGVTWTLLSTRSLARRATSLTFTSDDGTVLICDKSGDVYSYSLTDPATDGVLLMGHISMLLDIVLVCEDKLLVTCDRDEKIRVSHYPNAHSIHSYCLGHTDFVSRLVYDGETDLLMSGSGDGTLRGWCYKSGEELSVVDCNKHLEKYPAPIQDTDSQNGSQHDTASPQDKPTRQLSDRQLAGRDIKCLTCCRQRKILAVGFEKIPVVLLYKYSQSPVTLTFMQEVILQGDLWDVTFDPEGRLWVLQADQNKSLMVYIQDITTNKFEPVSEAGCRDNHKQIHDAISAVGDQWPLLKESKTSSSLFSVLHKVKCDNAKFYQERKQQKMDEQKQRYKDKCERRKRGKEVLPSGEGDSNSVVEESEVAPPGECSDVPVAPSGECGEDSLPASPASKRNKTLESHEAT